MLDNLEYFEYSLAHKELLLDKYYFSDEIIIDNHSSPLFANCLELDETISNYANRKRYYDCLHQDFPDAELDVIINKIIKLLEEEYMNLTAFAQSFSLFDSSFSSYSSLNKREKSYFIKEILDAFISKRFDLYSKVGYGYLQVLYDSHAHKRMSSAGAKKVASQLNYNNFVQVHNTSIKNRQFFLPDQVKKENYLQFLKDNSIDCAWTKNKQDKMPDAVFKYDNKFYFVEHKHLKEGGGGQDKQLTEIVDLIQYGEPGITFISYMDGMYFNSLINPRPTTKMYTTKKDIVKYLTTNKENYFLNTSGFEKFLKDLTK